MPSGWTIGAPHHPAANRAGEPEKGDRRPEPEPLEGCGKELPVGISSRSMKAKWENEKNAIGKVQTLREQIEQTNAAIKKAQRSAT